jgi:hypothetical protein
MHTSAVVLQAKKGKAAPASAAPAVVEKFDLKKQIPVNLLKGASGCPSSGSCLSVRVGVVRVAAGGRCG